MRTIPKDIVAMIRFRSTNEGGRKTPTLYRWYGCLFEYEGEHFDCVLNLVEIGPVHPGDKIIVPIGFLNPELIKPRLKGGAKFGLWEGKVIADGELLEVIEREVESVDDTPFRLDSQ